ncbi:MAG: polyprenol monophosphomannose synthase [Candidatus Hydrogenedentota bacterium]|nr:MAG: polyprenol monophosphomannose synthase [Candidatus Hydrogenedentota bacterium]
MPPHRPLVIIPTYNEADNIERLVEEVTRTVDGMRVLVVDDNSPDGTSEAVRKAAAKNPNVLLETRAGKLGLGTAYIEGFRRALSMPDVDCVFGMDADFSHSPQYLPDFLQALDAYDVVVGSRYLNGISVVNWPIHRLFISFLANNYARFITGLPVRDCTSGFCCYKREVLDRINLGAVRTRGYSFLIEMKYRAHRLGFRIGETPIIFFERRSGITKMSKFDIFEAVFTVWKLRLGLYAR